MKLLGVLWGRGVVVAEIMGCGLARVRWCAMQGSVFVCLLLLTLSSCTTVPTAKAPSTKEEVANALLAIVPPIVMFSDLAEPHAARYGTAHPRDKAHANFMRNADSGALDALIRDALLRRFTEEELRALLAFCSTPEGHACLTKVAPFAAEVVPACLHEAAKAYRKTTLDAARGLLLP